MIPYNEREVLKLLQEESTQRKGFEMIVGQYSEQLYWQIRRMVLSHEDANDLLQNTFQIGKITAGQRHLLPEIFFRRFCLGVALIVFGGILLRRQ